MDMLAATLLIIAGLVLRAVSLIAGIGNGSPASGGMPRAYTLGKIMILLGLCWWLVIIVMWGVAWLA